MERDPITGARADLTLEPEEAGSAVSWPAVFAGAMAALAVSFVLLALAGGFGLKLGSPWPLANAPSDGFNPTLGAILVTIQVLSSAFGGYLAGRLRSRWVHVHSHEIHFRDTAHGLLAWAVATVAGVALAVTVLAPAAGRAAAPGLVAAASTLDPATLQAQAERTANIAAQASLFMGVGLLLSAFTASVAAGLGGLRRDEMHVAYWAQRAPEGRPFGGPVREPVTTR